MKPKINSYRAGLLVITILMMPLIRTSEHIMLGQHVINVHIDYMADVSHSHRPSQEEIDAVVQMFACQGITLNVVIAHQITHFDVIRRSPAANRMIFGFEDGPDTFGTIKKGSFDKDDSWHYALFAHQYEDDSLQTSRSSGLAETGGKNLMVTLGAFSDSIGTPWDRASTFAHELGHNLGLTHSGAMNEDQVGPYMPNLPSIMSYFYQLTGVRHYMEQRGLVAPGLTNLKNLDYSGGYFCGIDEEALNEWTGLGLGPVDWNCDGTVSGIVAEDVSNNSAFKYKDCGSDGARQKLHDFDEWAFVKHRLANPPPPVPADHNVVTCVTSHELTEFLKNNNSIASSDYQPELRSESCVNNRMLFAGVPMVPENLATTGTCSKPFTQFGTAYQTAQTGDIIILLPGSYPTGQVILSKPLIIGGSGGIIIGQ
jgi:hypothetical protein